MITVVTHPELRGWWLLLSSAFGPEPEAAPEHELQRWVQLAVQDDSNARQHLYTQLVHRVYRTVRGLTGSDADAEDVTQDAMLAVLTSLASYRPQPGARFVAWVMTIAVHTARRRFRRQRPQLTQSGELPDAGEESALDRDIDRARRRRALLRALGEMEAREREIVSLRYGAELTHEEIALDLGLTSANVRKICQRQRERIAARLTEMLQ